MALKSPRFASNAALQNAARSAPPIRRGANGQHVAAIQQAFIDLGLGMAISTKKAGKADGIFGGETESRVWQFQARMGLTRDGIVGRDTMAKLDELLPTAGPPPKPLPPAKMTHKINVHMRSIDNPTVPEFTQLKVMEEIYAQYLIRVDVLTGQSVGLTPGEQFTLNIVDGDCKWDQVSDEQRLLQNSGSNQGVGVNDIVVYFATVLREKNGETLQGCAGHAPTRPAVMIAASATDKTTMAHEVCHVLLSSSFTPVHVGEDANLMCSAPMCTGQPAYLSVAQLNRVFASKLLHKL
ncbi:peptidoglycan-binding domain-containing protein [Bosea sp. (in: a-proteobacteria)]|uniref:peptidoglycan-binding domain-containing protein n=1 Tax=Bosea sp. (in: a-proteobacteria) TaxID=1871050 RepID=UPI00260D64D8|nr:peptidoglycan-binding domain-containing protein [Bosea sp. (in: a-proteobacteria)]MCO5093508.1 peptidoglycan-binding protein [Bosea sp. (in: a-proteobacteria)]